MSNGQRPARTAQDVAQLEADNEYLHGENERLARELAVITSDRSRLQIENAMLEGRSRENLLRATRMETIVRVHSSGLVAALTEITQERTVERSVRRQVQEEQLAEETGPAPRFLRRDVVETEAGDQRDQAAPAARPQVQPEARRESDEDRSDRLRGAAERLARPVAPVAMRPGRIDHTLADRDDRLPRTNYPGHEEYQETESLRELAGGMTDKTRG